VFVQREQSVTSLCDPCAPNALVMPRPSDSHQVSIDLTHCISSCSCCESGKVMTEVVTVQCACVDLCVFMCV